MRHLNKIIFINSAQIKYAEINLDGNVHLIGTQGVGKSTILRAILFFYNADSQGLGISKQKSSYVDYYFKYSNSYIIYEVLREEGKFCIVSYKSQHRVCLRFFSDEYKQNYFINEGGYVPDNWEGIAKQLDINNIFYTKRKIEEYRDYRNIIYGNNDDKKSELKRFSISESKDYLQVPKTIQNVFLNSKMEAEFIKQMIISSLDSEIQIDLKQYTHHLNDFEIQLSDIRNFRKPATISQANTISTLYIEIKHLEQEKLQLAKELAWAINENEHKEPKLNERLEKQHAEENILKNKIQQVEKSFNEKEKKINENISRQNVYLEEAEKLRKYYEDKNIHQIIAKVEKKNDFDKEVKYLQNEKILLSRQFEDLEIKFRMKLETLENQHNDFKNNKESQKNKISQEFLNFRDSTTKEFNEWSENYRRNNVTEIEKARIELENKKQNLNELNLKKIEIKLTRFFEKDIVTLEKEMQELDNSIKQLPIEIKNLDENIKNIQKEWNVDLQSLQEIYERNREKINEQITDRKNKITEIELYITNSKDSLYGWLSENYPDWELSIGKIIDDKNVLFNSSLNPRLIEKSNYFYGIEINLNEIDKKVKTINDYESEKLDLDEQIKLLKQNDSELFKELDNDREKLKKKYSPKIGEKNKSIAEKKYSLEMNKSKLLDRNAKLNELKKKSQAELENQLEKIDNEIGNATKICTIAESKIKQLENEQNKVIDTKEKEKNKIIENEELRINSLIIAIETDKKEKTEEFERQKERISIQKNEELSERGADTERLNEIENKLNILNADLADIENNRDLVANYKDAKKKFIDKMNVFKQEKQNLEKQLGLEINKYKEQKAKLDEDFKRNREIISDLDNQIKIIKEDTEKFKLFRESECFKSIEVQFMNLDKQVETKKRVSSLIDEIRNYNETLHHKKDDLRTITMEFLGKFSENNIFQFPKYSDAKLFDFVEMLYDFIEERKIEKYEKEVNERFASIVSTIGTQTNNLMAKSGEIRSIVTKINNDFREKNFVGVIKNIELKIEDSKNEIVQLLNMIKDYNNENGLELGSQNIFSSDNQDKKNKEAVDLLKQFVKKINESGKDSISLSDSFELKFRIEENQNDTGWVEKLSNVGSEGTDTLVKAMLNIMLLNIFKENVSKKFKDFKLHCMMDEIGKLHPKNVRGILKFANDRNILLINGSPTEFDALAFNYIYILDKDKESNTKVKPIIIQHSEL